MDMDDSDSDDPEELDWKWVDVDFLDEPFATATNTNPAVCSASNSRNGTSCVW